MSSFLETLSRQELVILAVREERRRQDKRWGVQNHQPDVWIRILGEEFGEVCKAVNDDSPLVADEYRSELVQVAAIAIAAIESLDRQMVVDGA